MTDKANLEDGFYWVRRNWSIEWEVARYVVEVSAFYVVGSITGMSRYAFTEIDPRPIKREDVK